MSCHDSCYATYKEQLSDCPCIETQVHAFENLLFKKNKIKTTTTEVSTATTTTTELTPIDPVLRFDDFYLFINFRAKFRFSLFCRIWVRAIWRAEMARRKLRRRSARRATTILLTRNTRLSTDKFIFLEEMTRKRLLYSFEKIGFKFYTSDRQTERMRICWTVSTTKCWPIRLFRGTVDSVRKSRYNYFSKEVIQ